MIHLHKARTLAKNTCIAFYSSHCYAKTGNAHLDQNEVSKKKGRSQGQGFMKRGQLACKGLQKEEHSGWGEQGSLLNNCMRRALPRQTRAQAHVLVFEEQVRVQISDLRRTNGGANAVSMKALSLNLLILQECHEC